MAMRSRSAIPLFALLALVAFVATRTTFVQLPEQRSAPTEASVSAVALQQPAALGVAAGWAATSQPAHALLLQDEILPISFAVIGATLWGIVLGFVLLRLQEAFPE
eukprot:TRINITY_DN909_c0_g4_i1.p3 TRINITY_DN909_c0_g4~~TRINITY_DN909_c0_g4_i1.p3  ORF type:complete len:106 (+),score=24.24 TRINITY_DN909_c0_g4_i1:87-404(+)